MFRDFFHKAVAKIRQWGFDVPIITGGPYATSDCKSILQDKNIDLAVLGEGETTLCELITKIIENDKKLPPEKELQKIQGLAFIPGKREDSPGFAREIVMLDSIRDRLAAEPDSNLDNVNNSSDLAYMVFTSGSTGKPKGVMVEHKNVSRLVKQTNYIDITPTDTVLQLSNYAFDGSVFDIFAALLNGAKSVMVSEEDLQDVEGLSALIIDEKITLFFVTTALFNVLVDTNIQCFAHIRSVLFGGERVSFEHVKKALQYMKDGQIIHVYGPTETTVYATFYYIHELDEHLGTVPIGKPLANTTVYVLDKNMRPVPGGAAGEIYIGGDSVARGYFKREELTAEKFVTNPFVENDRLYKTGDLARMLPDGNVVFLGRIDNQVKLRGFRIELGEIESQLLNVAEISEAVVLVKNNKTNDKYLCAYVVLANSREIAGESPPPAAGVIDFAEIKRKLAENLPDYMIPTYFVPLEKMPLNANGKIDKKALPEPGIAAREDFITPKSELEQKVVEIWADVLNVDRAVIGTHSNFFELGGHSLKATILVSKIHKELNVKVPLAELFRTQTISGLIEYIGTCEHDIHASIKPVEHKEYYDLSSAQKRLYILQQMDASATGYNIPGTIYLNRNFKIDKLEGIFNRLIARHESLRSSFRIVDEEPVQIIHDNVEFEIEYYGIDKNEDWTVSQNSPPEGGLNDAPLDLEKIIVNEPTAVPRELEKIMEHFVRPFDLTRAPLLRVGFAWLEENYILLVDMHHIISDGTSHAVLIEEFNRLYNGDDLPELRLQYKDYSEWQNNRDQQQKIKEQEAYWLTLFSDELPVLNLPTDYIRPAAQSFTGKNVSFNLDHRETAIVKSTASKTDTTLYMVLLTIYNVMLCKLCGQEDIIVGTPIASRRHADLQRIIGMFVNTLALRNFPSVNKSFEEFLADVKKRTLDAYENQEYQFEELVDRLSIPRDVSRNPLFDVMFNLLNQNDQSGAPLEYKENAEYVHKKGTSKFDMTLTAIDAEEFVYLNFEYCTQLFGSKTIDRFIRYFKRIIWEIDESIERKISDIEMISDQERKQILYDFNHTVSDYPEDKTIHELFTEQVFKSPDRGALVDCRQGKSLTYLELHKKSDQVAGMLRSNGLHTDSIVGIMVKRSMEMIIGILGILKSGGAYLPIDLASPTHRIEYMLKNSNADILLTQPALAEHLSDDFRKIDISDTTIYTGSPGENENSCKPDNLSYIIYTSGTTGMPKGVAIEHRGVVNLLMDQQKRYPFGSSDTYLLKTPYIFDVSVMELFGWFVGGGKLAILEQGSEKDPYEIIRQVQLQHVTHLNFVPSMFNAFIDALDPEDVSELTHLRYLFLAGEALKPESVRSFQALGLEVALEDLYGPTEATVYASKYSLSDWDGDTDIPIGKPLQNVKLLVLDRNGNLQGIGIPGELCIGGTGVARGYLNNPELTAEKFVSLNLDRSYKFYKTGDLARWRPDGNLEYLGRIDNQVKIRGLRIELEEIENRLLTHENIKEAIVRTGEDKNKNKYLCAYIVPEIPVDSAEIKHFLSRDLPDYMIPAHFVPMERIPLNSSGKVDRSKLPEPEITAQEEYMAPRNEIERILAEVWSGVLGVENIGIKDNFFRTGGDSIKTIQIASRMRKAGYKIEMNQMFKHPTIIDLSPYVKKVERHADQSAVTGAVQLTPIQKWFFEGSAGDRHHFNQALMLYWEDGIDENAVKAIFEKVREHHDALRMTFKIKGNEPVQFNNGPEQPLSLDTYDFRGATNGKQLMAEKIEMIQAGIDLENGPLMKSGLFHLEDGNRLLIVIHHLVIDGVSWRILAEDIDTLYRQYKDGKPLVLPRKTDSFKLWSEKLMEYANHFTWSNEKEYWRDMEETAVNPDQGPQKDIDGENLEKTTATLSFTLSADKTRHLLTHINKAFNTDINDILLTALGLAIRDVFGSRQLLIAVEGHGREEILEDIDISRTVGWFTSLYPVKLDFSVEYNLARQIKVVKETLHRIPNKGIGYGILRYLTSNGPGVEKSFRSEPRISFNYLGNVDADVKQTSFAIAGEPFGSPVGPNYQRRFEIDVTCLVMNNSLDVSLTFSTGQYRTETMELLAAHIKISLLGLISYCLTREEQEKTPSDCTFKGLGIEQFDGLREQYADIRDIYRLSPMQEGILFQTLYDKTSSAYFLQAALRFCGPLDVERVKQSLNILVQRHDVLRTVFIQEGLEQPLQIVLNNQDSDVYLEDIRHKDHPEEYIRAYREKEKNRGFDLQKNSLMRIAVLRVADNEYRLIWSSHHVIMDGWCLKILITEFFQTYHSLIEGRAVRLAAVTQYREYIKWLETRDMETSRQYWRNYLARYEETAGIPKSDSMQLVEGHFVPERETVLLDHETTGKIKHLAGRNNVTMNTFFQAVWGILLAQYNKMQDVVFGSVVSGRPPEIEGIESMVGLFINTIPIRIRVGKVSFHELLQTIQASALDSESHHYFPLVEIQAESTLKQHLLDHILEFHNLPKAEQLDGINISQADMFEQTNYDFYVFITCDEQLEIQFQYNANAYDLEQINRICQYVCRIIDQVLADDTIRIDRLSLLSEDEEGKLLAEFKVAEGVTVDIVDIEDSDADSEATGLPQVDFDF
jgi:bacitracin synthase 3